jgi:hypothetical protein
MGRPLIELYTILISRGGGGFDIFVAGPHVSDSLNLQF